MEGGATRPKQRLAGNGTNVTTCPMVTVEICRAIAKAMSGQQQRRAEKEKIEAEARDFWRAQTRSKATFHEEQDRQRSRGKKTGAIDGLKGMWENYGMRIMYDGWTSPTRKSIINSMVYYDSRAVFLKSVDAFKEKNDAKYIYRLLEDVVLEVSGERRPAHCIDIMLKDMEKLKLVQSVVERETDEHLVYSHGFALQLLRSKYGGELVKPGVTRFATNYIALKSFEAKKVNLRSMFAS
ncbi:uncharacterized protein LOC122648209 [Telopea speciosissima]|uniref:uncharacterized protein LOC122648209 n=1 Tax=Telopea speciosissima TaxID=54955 RepID=UPI001CC5BDE4|nr:uncharacterized protein LOC122648209 [Telopea speciosissima]